MLVNRKKLLESLRLASRGLSSSGLVDQGDDFLFRDGRITCFDGEVRVQSVDPCGLEVVVPSTELMKLISRFSAEEIEVSLNDNSELNLSSKGRKARATAGISCRSAVRTAADEIPKVTDWTPATEKLAEKLKSASQVCGHDITMGVTMCVRILPDRIEACDQHRAIRIMGDTGFAAEILLAAHTLSAIKGTPIISIANAPGWCHFLVQGGMVTLRTREFAKYPDLDELLSATGPDVQFPKELSEAIHRAQVTTDQPLAVAGDTSFVSRVRVELKPGEGELTSRSGQGWYKETFDLDYDGPVLSFDCHPESLLQILGHSYEIQVTGPTLVARSDDTTMIIAVNAGL